MTQQNYRTIEQELLAIVYTVLEFRSILLRAMIFVSTDNKKLAFKNLSSSYELLWPLFLDIFDCIFTYVAGKDNVLGDALLRLPRTDNADPPKEQASAKSSNGA